MIKTFITLMLAGAFALLGCSSSDSSATSGSPSSSGSPSPAAGSTEYKGTFAGAGGEGGSIDVTVATSGTTTKAVHPLAVQQVTGTVRVTGGASITVTGSFDDATKTLTITGGGYSFTGSATSDGASGTYTGPTGKGAFTVLAGANAIPYCGTFAGGAKGVWNFVVNGAVLSGTAIDDKGNPDTLTGTVTGNAVSITTKNASTAAGTISGSAAMGTYENKAANLNGTWTGTAGCGG
jgi:hypothetical protein